MAATAQINISIKTKDAIKSIADLDNEIGGTIVTVNDLRMTVDTLTQELESTEVGTDRWNELKLALIDANTELKNYELSIESLDNEQVASEMKSVAGGLMDIAGGFALVGASGEKMEELIQVFAQVEGATKILTGSMEAFSSIQKLQNNIVTRAAKAQEFLAAASLKSGVSSKIASVGMSILNAVMNLNPVFLIITGITALVGALAWFMTSTNEAAEAQERLNAQLEQQNRLLEVNSRIREQNNNLVDKTIDAKEKLLQKELEILKKTEKPTEEQQKRIKEINNELNNLNLNKLENVAKRAGENISDFSKQAVGQFESIKAAIRATDEEDGINDINYDNPINQVTNLQKEFNKLSSEFSKTKDVNAYNAGLTNLINKSAEVEGNFKKVNKELGSAEQEVFQDAIDGAGELTDKLIEIRGAVTDVGEANIEYNTAIDLQIQNNELKNQEMLQEKRQKQQEAYQKLLQKRKEVLNEIDGTIKRQRDAERELIKVRVQGIEDESQKAIELLDLQYGAERDKLIDGAIKREEAKIQEKFVNGKISEEQYRQEINELYENGADNLLEVEKELLEEKKKLYEEEKQEIRDKEQVKIAQAKTTEEQIDVIQQESQSIRLEQEKQARIFEAQQNITDEIALQEELLKINKEYQEKEINQVKQNLKEQIELRTAQYNQDLLNKDLTDEEKRLLEAEYNRDIIQLNADAQTKIQGLYEGTVEKVKENTFVLNEQQQLILDTVVNGIQQSMSIINDALSEVAARATAEREAQYEKDVENLDKQLANQTLSREQYDAKIEELNQTKRVKELQEKRKQFKIDKANQIIQAVISTAQAVLQGLAAGPPPIGPILAGINGALGAVQIGVISAQQFRAARGGVVPGSPSNQDSVSSLLAPGEMVINSNSSQMFGGLLSAVNQLGGGIPLVPEIPTKSTGNPSDGVYRENKPQSTIRAYVVESEVTEKQRKVSRIERSSEY